MAIPRPDGEESVAGPARAAGAKDAELRQCSTCYYSWWPKGKSVDMDDSQRTLANGGMGECRHCSPEEAPDRGLRFPIVSPADYCGNHRSTAMFKKKEDKPETPAFDELERLLKKYGYRHQRVAVLPDGLWIRLRSETHDPFGGFDPAKRNVLWYRNWTMLIPTSQVLHIFNVNTALS